MASDDFMTYNDITVTISSQGDGMRVKSGRNLNSEFPMASFNVGVCDEGVGFKGRQRTGYSRQEEFDYVKANLRGFLDQNRTILVMA